MQSEYPYHPLEHSVCHQLQPPQLLLKIGFTTNCSHHSCFSRLVSPPTAATTAPSQDWFHHQLQPFSSTETGSSKQSAVNLTSAEEKQPLPSTETSSKREQPFSSTETGSSKKSAVTLTSAEEKQPLPSTETSSRREQPFSSIETGSSKESAV